MSSRETILEYLITTALPKIKAADGYNLTLAKVGRDALFIDELSDSHFPAVFIPRADEDFKNIGTAKRYQSAMTVIIWGYVRRSSGRVQPELSKLIDDVKKAITSDITLGNNVSNNVIKSLKTDEGEIPEHAYFRMEVELTYEGVWSTP